MAQLRGVDYSFAPPDPRELAVGGYSFALRYASRVDGGKNLTPTEARLLSLFGLRIATVWENVARDRDPLKGREQGVRDALDHYALVRACGGPPTAVLYYAVDWNASEDEYPRIAEYFEGCVAAGGLPQFVGCYGHTRLLTYLFDANVIGHDWVPAASSWSAGHAEPRARLRQLQPVDVPLAGGVVDIDTATEEVGWRLDVTFAPADLLDLQRYAQTKTGQDWNSLGIVGDTSHQSSGGYHVGNDVLRALGTCPGSGCAGSDYSYADARAVSANGIGRDLADADTLAGDDNAASAFDLGSGFPNGYDQFLAYNRFMRDRMLANDPRTRDIREVIYTLDGVTVHRIDRTGRQPDAGDSSHLSHTHHSYFRDSLGRRNLDDNHMGLLKEFFGDPATTNAATEDDEMFALNLAVPHRVPVYGPDPADPTKSVITGYEWPAEWPDGYASYTIPTVGDGTIPWGRGWVSLCNDTFGKKYCVRVAGGNGTARVYNDGVARPGQPDDRTLANLQRWYAELDTRTAFVSVKRMPVDASDPMTAHVTACVEIGQRTV